MEETIFKTIPSAHLGRTDKFYKINPITNNYITTHCPAELILIADFIEFLPIQSVLESASKITPIYPKKTQRIHH